MSQNFFETPVTYLKGVGPQRAEALKKELNIVTFGDLLHHFPFRYVDRTRFYKVKEANGEMPYIQLKGKITDIKTIGEKRNQRLVAVFRDDSGEMELVWFQGARWIAKLLKPDAEYVVFGKPTLFKNKINIAHPEIEEVSEENTKITSALQAVYNTTEKLKSKGLESRGIGRIIRNLVPLIPSRLPESLPRSLVTDLKLVNYRDAMQEVHFPTGTTELRNAQFRLKFEELFYIQMKLLQFKIFRQEKYSGQKFEKIGEYFNRFYHDKLPFPLTNAQKRVMKEIRKDVGSGKQMNRLLQGDVGSGKTVVALMTMLISLDNNTQAAFMAPTEILANQHYASVKRLAEGIGINIALLTGSTKKKAREEILESLRTGDLHIIIGTHALLEDRVQFKNLGLVVIDEQHRFGVQQRARLWQKNNTAPHILVMTATPIPRTLAMTLYGDLDVSVIDEMPPGRKPVHTFQRTDSARLRVFGFMKEQIEKGRQIYVVYPLIEESEKMDYKDLMDGYESIVRAFPLPKYKVSIVHGRMKSDARDWEMNRFVKGETQIMVATTVIEVGVDVSNATTMVIESAERFGLSQLHQLRGRVGRGGDQSYCILMTSGKLSTDAKIRIDTMVRTNDGFEIAEIDLKLRGPGDLAGTQQSGILDLKIADITKDGQILQLSRKAAMKILEEDPSLAKAEHTVVATRLKEMEKRSGNWSRIS